MNEAKLLLNAYYEVLHELLEVRKDLLTSKAEELLREEVANRWQSVFDDDKYAAYREACMAFVEERIETYNPIGIQYTFERIRAREVVELELQLDWYDSKAEFEALMEAIYAKAEAGVTDETMQELTEELITKVGAFPNRSIISAYEAEPVLGKLPDYVVSRAIEETIK
jgi:hypothetical protein